MNFLDAMRSGCPIRRHGRAIRRRDDLQTFLPAATSWSAVHHEEWWNPEYLLRNAELTQEMILATDWETGPCSRKSIVNAVMSNRRGDLSRDVEYANQLADFLGLP